MNCALNQQFSFKTFLITLLSFLLLFSISCKKNPTEPESEDLTATIPTATGDPATDLTDAYYKGILSLKSYNTSATSGITKEELDNSISSGGYMIVYLNITNNNLKCVGEPYFEGYTFEDYTNEQAQQLFESQLRKSDAVQLLKSGSKYSVSEVADYSSDGYININKLYIEFTISGDNISITYIVGLSTDNVGDDGVNYKYSYKTTYEGTLTKYTPTTSGI